jgi:hypothetical protein
VLGEISETVRNLELQTKIWNDAANQFSIVNDTYSDSSTLGKEDPHTHYFNNIKSSSKDPRIPEDPDREYTYDDFRSIFEVEPIHQNEVEDEVKTILNDHNITENDDYYKDWVKKRRILLYKYRKLLALDSLEDYDREKMVIKWISVEKGFGVIAKRLIKKTELIGRYTGVVGFDNKNTDYVIDSYSDVGLPK